MEVVLRTLVGLTDRSGSSVRIIETVLNICDTLLNMPSIDTSLLFEGIVRISLRCFLHLGCPIGCNEGMRTPQADFLRVRLKSLLSQMHRLNSSLLAEVIRQYIEDS